MKISTDSWHYKMICTMWEFDRWNPPPKSLCPYFWTVVGSTLVFPLWRLVMAAKDIHFDMPKPSWSLPSMSHSRRVTIARTAGVVLCVGFGIYDIYIGSYILAGVMFGFAVYNALPSGFLGELIKSHRKEKAFKPRKYKEPKIKKPKEPNLFWEYIKARKQKVCPLIEYVDPDEEEMK